MSIWKDFHPTADKVMSAVALMGIIGLAFVLVAFEPHGTSRDLLLILIGAMSAAVNNSGTNAKTTTTTDGDPPVKTTTDTQ